MRSNGVLITTGLAAMFVGQAAYAGQHEGHQVPGATTATPVQMSRCVQAQPVVHGVLDAALKRLEEARLTNSAAAMRDAADDVQTALLDVRAQLVPCAQLQTSTADPVLGQTVPNVPQAPTAAPGEVDPHAGHAMPASPPAASAPRTRPAPLAGAARTPSASAAADPHAGHAMAPAAADPHAGHVMPPAAADPHAGHVMPPVEARPSAPPQNARLAEGNNAAALPSAPSAAAAVRSTPPTRITDLRCGSQVDQKTVPRMLYGGRMYYFCTEAERAEFAKSPGRYVTAPAQTTPEHAH